MSNEEKSKNVVAGVQTKQTLPPPPPIPPSIKPSQVTAGIPSKPQQANSFSHKLPAGIPSHPALVGAFQTESLKAVGFVEPTERYKDVYTLMSQDSRSFPKGNERLELSSEEPSELNVDTMGLLIQANESLSNMVNTYLETMKQQEARIKESEELNAELSAQLQGTCESYATLESKYKEVESAFNDILQGERKWNEAIAETKSFQAALEDLQLLLYEKEKALAGANVDLELYKKRWQETAEHLQDALGRIETENKKVKTALAVKEAVKIRCSKLEEALQEAIKKNQEFFEKYKKEKEEDTQAINKLHTVLSEATTSVAEKKDTILRLSKQAEKDEESITLKNRVIENLRSQADNLSKEIQKLREREVNDANTIKELGVAIDDLTSQNKENQEKILDFDCVQKRNFEMIDELEKLELRVYDTEEQCDKLKEELHSKELELQAMKENHDALGRVHTKASIAEEDMRQKYNSLQSTLKQRESELSDMQDKLDKLEYVEECLLGKKDEIERLRRNFQKEDNKSANVIKRLSSRVDELNKLNQDLSSTNVQLQLKSSHVYESGATLSDKWILNITPVNSDIMHCITAEGLDKLREVFKDFLFNPENNALVLALHDYKIDIYNLTRNIKFSSWEEAREALMSPAFSCKHVVQDVEIKTPTRSTNPETVQPIEKTPEPEVLPEKNEKESKTRLTLTYEKSHDNAYQTFLFFLIVVFMLVIAALATSPSSVLSIISKVLGAF